MLPKPRRKLRFHQIKLCLCIGNRWHLSGWSSCSKTCGRGLLTRELSCREKVSQNPEEYKTVSESSCKGIKPTALQRACYKVACPAEWVPSPWGEVKTLLIIIRLAPRAGKMNRILRCDWLPERARWSYLARSGYGLCPAMNIYHVMVFYPV